MKKLLLLPAFLVAISFTRAQYAPFYPEEFVVSASSLNLREAPDPKSKKVASMPRGTVVQFVEAYNDGEYMEVDSLYAPWYKVRYQNQTGYVFGAYVAGTTGLYYEGHIFDGPLPPLNWYGVFARDSFSDEIRKIDVRVVEEMHEFYGVRVNMLKTNQKDRSKFIVGSFKPMRTGYAGPLGIFDTNDHFYSAGLPPGGMLGISPGYPEGDTTTKAAYVLTAIGCAEFGPENFVQVKNYRLYAMDFSTDPPGRQDMTPWVTPMAPEISPSVNLGWYGDLDGDNRPDALLDDSPYEVSGRTSLFLSSRARPGEFLRKVCEYTWPGD